jgi:single-strand DNA-binding protein
MTVHVYAKATLGRDAELRKTGEQSVTNLSLAVSYGKKDATTGKRATQWIDGALWGKRAEAMAQYLVKGQAVLVSLDDVHIEQYTTRDNTTGSKLVGRVTDIEFAGPAPQQSEGAPPQRPAPPPQRQAPAPRQQAAAAAPTGFDDMDDDIPFITQSMTYDMQPSKARRMLRGDF